MTNSSDKIYGRSDQTQAFNLSSSDATLPRLEIPNEREGLAELTIVRGPSAGERFILDISEVTVGRDPKCEVFLNDRTVSRRHAHLTLQGGRAYIEDLGSLNGTWVDGAIVSQGELHNGSTIQIGTFKMIFNMH